MEPLAYKTKTRASTNKIDVQFLKQYNYMHSTWLVSLYLQILIQKNWKN